MNGNPHPALSAAGWPHRNAAVKELGDSRDEESANLLLMVLKDRRPSPWWQRLLGEPWLQVGFVRRNAWKGLENKTISPAEIGEIVLPGLRDSYYEVRAQVYLTLKAWAVRGIYSPGPELVREILSVLRRERDYEVICCALEALPSMISGEQAREIQDLLRDHPNLRVREAMVGFLRLCFRTGKLEAAEVRHMLSGMVLLSESFRPVFSVREKLAGLDEELGVAR